MIYSASLVERTEDKLDGYRIIKTREALEQVLADNEHANKVLIRKDFANKYFTPSGLQEFIHNAKWLNRNLTIELEESKGLYTEDKFIQKILSSRNPQELLTLAAAHPTDFYDTVKRLCTKSNVNQKELLSASNTVSQLQATIEAQRKELDEVKHALAIEAEDKNLATSRLDVLVKRINYQYNIDVDKRYLFNVEGNSFDKVIYIKEITRVQFVDSLVRYLREIFKVMYGMPTRLVVIESYYGTGKAELYSDLKPHYAALQEKDVIHGDILMLGIQPKLMRDILKNAGRTSILIVLDRAGYKVPHVRGQNVEYLYTVSDVADAPEGVPLNRIISYSEDTLYIPYIVNFNKFDGNRKLATYSSFDVCKSIIELAEGR